MGVSSPPKILIIEEDDQMRAVARRSIAQAGFVPLTARCGQEGVTRFRCSHHEISAVLLTINLPVLDGFETVRRLRIIDAQKPIVVASFYGQFLVKPARDEQLAITIVPKPYCADKLLSLLLPVTYRFPTMLH